MKKLTGLLSCYVLIFSILFLQGCASDTPFVRKDTKSLSPLKVVRHETPPILRSTMAETFFLSTAAVALPGGSALLVLSDEYAKSKGGDMQMKIPDFGNLVMHKFVEKMNGGLIKFPVFTVENKPVLEDYADSCTVIEFKVKRVAYGYLDFIRGGGNGVLTKCTVTMKDSSGDILWEKNFTYLSKDFERTREVEEYEADDGKLLKEELEFAAEKTVSDFIAHLNGEQLYAIQQ